jgi:hypothetical protein
MRYITIDPIKGTVKAIETDDFQFALETAGLESGRVDHGVVELGVSIVVHEFGLFVDPERQRYFAIGDQLFAGKALLYGFDYRGETVDLRRVPDVKFFLNAKAVEKAIVDGTIQRPQMKLDSEVIWSWPDPRPAVMDVKE